MSEPVNKEKGTECPPDTLRVCLCTRLIPPASTSSASPARTVTATVWRPFSAIGQGEPLRCCLRYAEAGEQITLISYTPFESPSVWRGRARLHSRSAMRRLYANGRLPERLATGPRVLRTYRGDDTMNYEHNTVVSEQTDLEPIIERLLSAV